MAPRTTVVVAAGAGVTAIVLAVLGLVRLGDDGSRGEAIALLILSFVATCALLGALLAAPPRRETTTALVAMGLFLRAVAFTQVEPTKLSDDLYRYVFEGHVVLAGASPYHFPPDSPHWDELTERRQLADLRSRVNNPSISTIYPPLAEGLFAAGALGDGIQGWRVIVQAFDLGLVALLLVWLRRRGRRPEWLALYLLHPLVLIEATVAAHVDLPAAALLVAALMAHEHGRRRRAWWLLTASVLVKVVSLVAAPLLFVPRRWHEPIAPLLAALALLGWAAMPPDTPDLPSEVGEARWVGRAAARAEDPVSIDSGTPASRRSLGDEVLRWQPLHDGRADVDLGRSRPLHGFTTPVSRAFAVWSDEWSAVLTRRGDVVGTSRRWDDLVGRFTMISVPPDAHPELHGRRIEFDGSGRLARDLAGYYGEDADGFWLQSAAGAAPIRLLLDGDRVVVRSEDGRLFGLKFSESPLFGLASYAGRWTANAPAFRLARACALASTDDPRDARVLAQRGLAVLLLVVALVLAVRRTDPTRGTFLLLALFWLAAPALYPWYLLWLVPFLVVHGAPGRTTWTILVLLTYGVAADAAFAGWSVAEIASLGGAGGVALLGATWSRLGGRSAGGTVRESSDQKRP